MKIAILGTGSLGCFFAARLNAVAEVHLFGHWEKQKAHIREHGLRYQDLDGKQSTAVLHVSEVEKYPKYFDLVLVLVKSFQTKLAAKEASQLLNTNSAIAKVLSLQNGLGNREALQEVCGENHVFAGSTTQAARIQELGVVVNTGNGEIYLPKDFSNEVMLLFEQAGFVVKAEKNMEGILWTKLAINAAINPLTAMLRVNNGALLDHEITEKCLVGLAKEVQAVAQKSGISLTVKSVANEAKRIAEITAKNRSSMLSDIDLGRQTEIAAICGAVIEQGEKVGVPTPLNRHVYRMVKAAESDRRFNLEDLEQLFA